MAAGDLVNGWVITLRDHEYNKFKQFFFTNPDVIKEKMIEVMDYFESYQPDVSGLYRESIIDSILRKWDPSMDAFTGVDDTDDQNLDIDIYTATLEYELKFNLKELGWQNLTKSVSKS